MSLLEDLGLGAMPGSDDTTPAKRRAHRVEPARGGASVKRTRDLFTDEVWRRLLEWCENDLRLSPTGRVAATVAEHHPAIGSSGLLDYTTTTTLVVLPERRAGEIQDRVSISRGAVRQAVWEWREQDPRGAAERDAQVARDRYVHWWTYSAQNCRDRLGSEAFNKSSCGFGSRRECEDDLDMYERYIAAALDFSYRRHQDADSTEAPEDVEAQPADDFLAALSLELP